MDGTCWASVGCADGGIDPATLDALPDVSLPATITSHVPMEVEIAYVRSTAS